MFTGSPFERSLSFRSFLPRLRLIVPGMVFFLALGSSAQLPPARIPPSSRRASPFAEAQTLLAQGRMAEAKEKTLELLGQNPASVEGLNLLGIIETDFKDYSQARDAFEKALKIAPGLTQTHNNLANLLVSEG